MFTLKEILKVPKQDEKSGPELDPEWILQEGFERRSWDMLVDRVRTSSEVLLTAHFGPRCPDFDGGCPICQRWKLLDELTASPYK